MSALTRWSPITQIGHDELSCSPVICSISCIDAKVVTIIKSMDISTLSFIGGILA